MRYIVLSIPDDAQAAELLEDFEEYGDSPVLTPSLEHEVFVESMVEIDADMGAVLPTFARRLP